MSNIVIVDLDGTLADGSHRMHLLPPNDKRDRTEDWDEFSLAAGGDAPLQKTIDLVNILYDSGKRIVILTGRCDVARGLTIDWLERAGVPYDDLIMRKAGDHRQDTIIKEEVVREIGLSKIMLCLDDLPHVVSHLRSLGLVCYQVAAIDEMYVAKNKGAGTTA